MFSKVGPGLRGISAMALAGIFIILSGCASYSQSFRVVDRKLLNNDPAAALSVLEKQTHSNRDLFLYACNKAMLLRMLGKFKESNKEIEKAKAIVQKYSAISVSEQTSSFIINDATRTYIGTPIEQIMLNVYAALNYLQMNDLDGARVEILQENLRLRELMQDDPDSPLSVDPFAQYLAGIIYEDLGEWSDAMIAYRKAYEAYQKHNALYGIAIPQQLKHSLIQMADKVGLTDERQKYEKEFNLQRADFRKKNPNTSELVFIFNNGLAPIKRESSVQIMEPQSGRMIRISLPYYEKRKTTVARARLYLQSTRPTLNNKSRLVAETEKVEDISSLEIETLKSKMAVITARALARAVAKHKLSDKAGEQNGLAGLIVNIAGVLTERADTRSWLTLPAEIQSARLKAPAGTYHARIELLDTRNNIIFQRSLGKIKLVKEHKYYLSFHWTSVAATTRH
ncbi:hypothetical protein MNBD_GAMMA24-1360 [hydrothermal vent metagenome]|uniref:Lipoprotein n=1 Tax=hydrothermal vent metagenome TaxID=652676 RepID=A0A3B1BEP1_9ZZZZ